MSNLEVSHVDLADLHGNPEKALSKVFMENRASLRRMVAMRMDRSLKGRIDPSDIIQETLFDAYRRLDDYLANPSIPFLKWLYFLAEQNTLTAYRRHVTAQKRSTQREQNDAQSRTSNTGSLHEFAISDLTGPVQKIEKLERMVQLHRAISMLNVPSQTVVRMRFLEGRSLAEISAELGISVDAVAKRAMRSLLKLTEFANELGLGSVD